MLNPSKRRTILAIPCTIILFLYFFILPRDNRTSPIGAHHTIQYPFDKAKIYAQPVRLNAVRKELVHSWDSYVDHGYMSDSLGPLTGGHTDNFCGWSATLVDALDTLWIAGLHDEFDDAVDSLQHIDFSNPNNTCVVNLFEVTIRHLGGLLSAYDLRQDQRILPKLVELGEVLYRSFQTPNAMPCSHCRLMSDKPPYQAPGSVALAAQGTLSLEFARLSQITGNPKYLYSVMNLTEVFAQTQNDSTIPGLWGEQVDASTSVEGGKPRFNQISHQYSIGALSDSTYEYLVKGHLLLGTHSDVFRRMWELASPQIKSVILFRAQLPGAEKEDLLFTGRATRRKNQINSDSGIADLDAHMEHLSCFAGGLYGLSSRLFGNMEDLEIGKALTNGCVWAYRHSPLGIMAEAFKMIPCDFNANQSDTRSLVQKQCPEDRSVWEPQIHIDPITNETTVIPRTLPAGFLHSANSAYFLRPEAIESVFYMLGLKGDLHWREVGWEMWQAIQKYTRAPYGHAMLQDVFQRVDDQGFIVQATVTNGVEKIDKMKPTQKDEMESFWFGETLKYFYLLFDEPNVVSLDEFVLNTEAHPLRLTRGVRGLG